MLETCYILASLSPSIICTTNNHISYIQALQWLATYQHRCMQKGAGETGFGLRALDLFHGWLVYTVLYMCVCIVCVYCVYQFIVCVYYMYMIYV